MKKSNASGNLILTSALLFSTQGSFPWRKVFFLMSNWYDGQIEKEENKGSLDHKGDLLQSWDH